MRAAAPTGFNLHVPLPPSPHVSASADTTAERDYWQSFVWPALKALCDDLKLAWEAVDLRCEVGEEGGSLGSLQAVLGPLDTPMRTCGGPAVLEVSVMTGEGGEGFSSGALKGV